MTITGSITALPGVIDGFVIAPQSDFTPAADPHVQQLIAENAQLRAERDQLASINARLSRKLLAARNSLVGLTQHMEEE